MVKLDVIGSTAMYGIYIGVGVYVIKSILSIVFGYIYFPVEYAGPSYYLWRHKFCDQTISKSSYDPLAKNADNQQEPFLTYINSVQPFAKTKSLKADLETKTAKLEAANKILEKANALTSSDKQKKVDKATKAVEDLKQEISNLEAKISLSQEFNNYGFTALLNTPGFSEGFAYDSKKNYKIFKQFQNGNENKVLEADFHFLAFRHLFIQYLQKVNPKSKNWSTISAEQLNTFFNASMDVTDFTPSTLLKPDDRILKEITVTAGDHNLSIKVPATYEAAIKGYFAAAPLFKSFMNKMSNSSSMFKAVDNKLVFDKEEDFKEVEAIISLIGLKSFFETKDGESDSNMIREKVESFVTRVGAIKSTPLDIHILNRIYFFALLTSSDISYAADSSNKDIKENEAIEAKIEKVSDVLKANSSNKTSSVYQTAQRKHSVLVKSYGKRLIEQRFNAISEIIAKNLGSKGYVLDSKDDSRMPVLKYFAYPSVYGSSKKTQVASPYSPSAVESL